jgi:HK97 family phage portal protein
VGRKENPTSQLILTSLSKDNLFPSENYKTLSEAGYKNCMTVNACINAIAKNAASLEWTVENSAGDEIANHPFLALLNTPNEMQGKRPFLIELIGHLLLTGNAYILQVNGRRPEFLYNLRPDRMKVLAGTNGNLVRGYRFEADGHPKDFDLSQVRHIKLFNPIDDFYGLGPVSAAARAIDISNYSDVWNAAIIRNDMKPPGAFTAEGYLADQQFVRLKNQIEENYQGYDNAGRPLILDGGLKFTPFSMTPKDLDWLNSNKTNMRAICAVFGAVAAVGLFAIRMIVRGEIATLVDRLVEKYQTKEACRAIREDCAKLHRLERGQHGQNDKECGA